MSSGETIDGVTVLAGARVSLNIQSGGSVSGFVASKASAGTCPVRRLGVRHDRQQRRQRMGRLRRLRERSRRQQRRLVQPQRRAGVRRRRQQRGRARPLHFERRGRLDPGSGETIDGVTVLAGARVGLNVRSGGSVSGFVANGGGYRLSRNRVQRRFCVRHDRRLRRVPLDPVRRRGERHHRRQRRLRISRLRRRRDRRPRQQRRQVQPRRGPGGGSCRQQRGRPRPFRLERARPLYPAAARFSTAWSSFPAPGST